MVWKGVLKIQNLYDSAALFISFSRYFSDFLFFIYMYCSTVVSPSIHFILYILKPGFETSHFGSAYLFLFLKRHVSFFYPLWRMIAIKRVIFITSLLFSINLTGDINLIMLNRQWIDFDLKNNNSEVITKNSYVFRTSS